MLQSRSGILAVMGVGAVVLLGGCGTKPVPVKGVVLCDDKPLANAFVLFIPEEEEGRQASGTTDSNGVFQLTTVSSKDGAFPGAYRITVHYSDPVEVPPGLVTAEDVQAAMVRAGASRKTTIVLPPMYTQPDATVLKHRVPEDGDVKLILKSERR